MNKLKLTAGLLGVLAILSGAVAFAQTATNPVAGTITGNVQANPAFTQLGRGEVAKVDKSSGVITVTVYNECKSLPGMTCAAWYSMEKQITFGTQLILDAQDRPIQSLSEIDYGYKVRVYLKNGEVYAMKIVGPRTEPRMCTMEARKCPDGSYVGRSGPNCEFAACPASSTATSTPVGPMCGGIAAIQCPSGYACRMDGNYPDASGTCVKPALEGKKICVTRINDGRPEQDCKTIPPGVLRQGISSEQVKQLQERLIKEGFLSADSATGYFGNMTFGAVKQFQQAKGLPATGFVGTQTLGKMEAEND